MKKRFVLLPAVLLALAAPSLARNLELLSWQQPSNHELLDVEIDGSTMLIPGGLGGTTVFELDPQGPQQLSSIYVPWCEYGRVYSWDLEGRTAWAAGRECGIAGYDLTDPVRPEQIGTGAIPGVSIEAVIQLDSLLICAGHEDGVFVLNPVDPWNPEIIASLPTVNAWDLCRGPDAVWLADGEGGVKKLDLSDPEDPVVSQTMALTGTSRDLCLSNGRLFVASGSGGIHLLDTMSPSGLELLGSAQTSNFAAKISAIGETAVVADWDDVELWSWTGDELELSGYKNTGGRVMAVGTSDSTIIAAEWRDLLTWRFGDIQDADLDLSPHRLVFPALAIGESDTLSFTVENSGAAPLSINSLYSTHASFTVNGLQDTIFPDEIRQIFVVYTRFGNYDAGELVLLSNDPDEPDVRVDLQGSGTGLQVGETAPLFNLPIITNGSGNFSLAAQQGNPVLIAYFATW